MRQVVVKLVMFIGACVGEGHGGTAHLGRHGVDVVASIGGGTLGRLRLPHMPRHHVWNGGI